MRLSKALVLMCLLPLCIFAQNIETFHTVQGKYYNALLDNYQLAILALQIDVNGTLYIVVKDATEDYVTVPHNRFDELRELMKKAGRWAEMAKERGDTFEKVLADFNILKFTFIAENGISVVVTTIPGTFDDTVCILPANTFADIEYWIAEGWQEEFARLSKKASIANEYK